MSAHVRIRHQGFTLVEILIGLALVGVVVGLAWIVLDSVRKVATEISQPIADPMYPVWQQLEHELDSLLPRPVEAEIPALRFSEAEGLEFVSLLKVNKEIPRQTELQYLLEDQDLLRITRSGYPITARTNRVATGIQAWDIQASHQGEIFTNWPPEEDTPLPARLTFTLERKNRISHSFDQYLPASYRHTPPNSESP
jgi:prepilin-type N-terminal cleavage/methylation domain-containing protein